MRIACWIPKATDTHSEYVTIIAFLLQQWLHERASLLRCTYIASSVHELRTFSALALAAGECSVLAVLPLKKEPRHPFVNLGGTWSLSPLNGK
jgi:hypothetical protein